MKTQYIVTQIQQWIFFAGCAIIFFGCRPQVFEIDIIDTPQKIVLNGFIGVGNPLFMVLTKSENIVADVSQGIEGKLWVENATVKVYENNILLGNITPERKYIFVSEGIEREVMRTLRLYMTPFIYPKAGATYKIEVTHPDYEPVTAEETVPIQYPIIKEVSYTKVIDESSCANDKVTIAYHMKIQDIPGENYYQVLVGKYTYGYTYDNDRNGNTIRWFDSTFYYHGTLLVNHDDDDRYNVDRIGSSGILLSDADAKDGVIEVVFKVNRCPFYLASDPRRSKDFLKVSVVVRNINKSFYQYVKDVNNQIRIQRDPYAEPIIVNTNTSNGFGILICYTQSQKDIWVEAINKNQ